MKTTICLIRHGQTDWNNKLVIQGRLNIPLNDTGIKQAHETGEYLKANDPSWDVIISSPLDRAIDTANIIKSYLDYNKDIIIDERFIEREFGQAEGKDIEPIIYDKIERDDVEGMEKSNDLMNRIYNTVMETAKKYEGKKIIVTTHSHVIKALLIKLDNSYNFQTARILNTALNYFYIEDDRIVDYKLNIK